MVFKEFVAKEEGSNWPDLKVFLSIPMNSELEDRVRIMIDEN